jgi:hypothetical protein
MIRVLLAIVDRPWGGRLASWDDDEEDSGYDAGGDSFGSIFSDLIAGAAGYVGGGGG